MLNPPLSSLSAPESVSAKKRYQAEACVAKHTGDRTEQQDRAAVFAHPTRKGTLMAGAPGAGVGARLAAEMAREGSPEPGSMGPSPVASHC